MLVLNLHKDVLKFLQRAHPRHAGQIALKMIALLSDPHPHDAKTLKGKEGDYLRADVGEYRIIYYVEGQELRVSLIGKRNDDEVYHALQRK